MANGLSQVAITYKGEDIQRAAPYPLHLDIEEGLDEIADHRGEDRVVPYKIGMKEKARRANQRTIVLAGWINAASGSDYRDLVLEVQDIFDPTSPGDLVATLENGDTATIRARAVAIGYPNPRVGNAREIKILMISVAPNWTIT